MRKKAISLLSAVITAVITAVFSCNTAIAYDTPTAYIDGDKIIAEFDAFDAPGVFVFYDGNGRLCGAALSESENGVYSSELIKSYDSTYEVKLWIADKVSDNGLITLKIAEKQTPTPTTAPTPEPTAEPEEEYEEEYEEVLPEIQTCGILIDCSTALAYDGIDENLLSMLPEDGMMVPYTDIEVTDGMTVYDALVQVCDIAGITIAGDSGYVSGINGLSEFSCGPLSGWLYSVNGEFPDVPIGEYTVSENDEIAIVYTCELGEDL